MSRPSINESSVQRYTIIVPTETRERAAHYLTDLRSGLQEPGFLLGQQLKCADTHSLTKLDLVGLLFDTKKPQIFAEMAVAGDGSDWTQSELGLLGDISMSVPVTIFDDGNHAAPTPHETPFHGTLVFTPGALLRNGRGKVPADWEEVTTPDGQLSAEGYYRLYRRRLLPVLKCINDQAGKPQSAFITVPGLGCGQFAGPFRRTLGARLAIVLRTLLEEHGASLPNLRAVYFDPYQECTDARYEIQGISLMIRPLGQPANRRKTQLCLPTTYAESGDDFSNCTFYSIVAWDHVSWPGNDFFAGSRATDDGVKAAATSSMATISGVEGRYDAVLGQYVPPAGFPNWADVVANEMRERGLRLWNAKSIHGRPDGLPNG